MSTLKNRSLKSLAFLFAQSGYSAVLGLITNIIITLLAAKEIFGIYATTLSTLAIFNYISDIGLAGALIQKKQVQERDLATVFTVQQIIIASLVLIGFSVTSYLKTTYNLPSEGVYLYWAILAGFFISSLKTIPSILLERSVKFDSIVKVQIIEQTLFYVIVSIGVIMGYQLYSFAVAVLVRALVGTSIMYRLSPWKPNLSLHLPSLKELLGFGLPFQANSFLALIKDELMVIFLGRALGLASLGEIVWAKKWAEAPIRIIMDNVSKILFPLLSRLQEDGDKLKKTVRTTMWLQTLILAPIMMALAVLVPFAVDVIPQYQKWESALPLFYIFCASAFFSTLSTPFMNIFNALKKPGIPFIFMIFWTCATWVLTPWFITRFGPVGFAWVQLMLSSTFIVVVFVAGKHLRLDLFQIHEVVADIRLFALPVWHKLSSGKGRFTSEPILHDQIDKLE